MVYSVVRIKLSNFGGHWMDVEYFEDFGDAKERLLELMERDGGKLNVCGEGYEITDEEYTIICEIK